MQDMQPANGVASEKTAMPSPFEQHLYVASQNIPQLSPKEWAEIRAQWCSEQVEYVFQSATRKNNDLVVVKLVDKGHALTRRSLKLFFEKKGDRWMENTARARETVKIVPISQ
jgi:hypothetical protein